MSLSALLHGGCAATYLFLATLLLARGRPNRTGLWLAGASLLTACWAGYLALAAAPALGGVAGALEMARGIGWYGFILHLYGRAAPADARLRRGFAALGWLLGLASAAALAAEIALPGGAVSLGSLAIELRLGLALATLLLIENLYRGTPEDLRWHINLPCVALAALCLFDLFLYSDAVLFRRVSALFLTARPVATAMLAPLLAVAAARNRGWGIDIHVSRSAVFHGATLVLGGLFLLGLAAAGEIFRALGADWGVLAETILMFGGAVSIGVLLTSASWRARLRALAVDHFFSHRYDYRREWARCIATLAVPDTYVPLHTRVIRAVAEVVDSPGGALYLRESRNGLFRWAGSWNMPALGAALAGDDPLLARFQDGAWVVEAGAAELPWHEIADPWLAVPLGHGGGLLGFVLVAHARGGFKLDREVFDLLRLVGREAAGFVAEQRATEGLIAAQQLSDYGRRFTFVAHDIKNVANQLELLLANAEQHLADPEFQRDLLTTLRASTQKIGALLARLKAPAGEAAGQSVLIPAEQVAAIVAAYRRSGQGAIVLETDQRAGGVAIGPEALEAAVRHLLDNALEASPGHAPVRIRLRHAARQVEIDIIDQGPGMTAEFIRDRLFRPFGSAKPQGSGIGVFQARALLQEAGGDLMVFSRPGEGTTMRLLLPLVGDAVRRPAPLVA